MATAASPSAVTVTFALSTERLPTTESLLQSYPLVIPQSLTAIYFIFPLSLYIAKTDRIPNIYFLLSDPSSNVFSLRMLDHKNVEWTQDCAELPRSSQ